VINFNTAIVDGDPLIYRCGFAVEKFNKELDILEVEPVSHAYYNINSMMKKIMKNATNQQIYLTAPGRSNFRFEIFPQYKANRIDVRKPVYYHELRAYLIKRYGAIVVEGEEADDRCSIEHCKLNNLGWDKEIYNSVVCSFDKDFNNIPGWHLNYVKDELYYVDELQALRNFYLQILTGDTSDGIPRIKKGWRQKESEEILKNCNIEQDMLEWVYAEMIRVLEPLTPEDFNFISSELIKRGQLVWLRREINELWTPKVLAI
jgi:hypothetical protein